MNDKIDGIEENGTQAPDAGDGGGIAYTTTVKLLKDQNPGTAGTSYFVPYDVVLALDEGIAPTWTATHTFAADANFGGNVNLAPVGKPASATLSLDAGSLKYAVATAAATHEFYVGGKAVGQIDDPANPKAGTSLVSKSYVDARGGGGSVQPANPKSPAVSIGSAVSNGSATTYMRSDVVLALDQGISPQWSAPHTFLSNINFGPSAAASFSLDNASLKYTVAATQGGAHEFYVGGKLAGQVDSPSAPQGNNSLVSKAYVDGKIPTAGNPVAPGVNLTGSAGSKTTYMRSDAVLALDQSIAPKWTGTHTFAADANFGGNVNLAPVGKPASATLSLDTASLRYAVASATATHEFYVGGKAVGQIDDPANPKTGTSLVSKSYVDAHGGGGTVQPGNPKNPAVSIGASVSNGSATTYMRSDAVLALDQGISPQWSAPHTFLSNINFGAPSAASLSLDGGSSLKYEVAPKGKHEFYVGQTLAAQVQDLSNVAVADIPDNALANWGIVRQYVDQHASTSGGLAMMVSYGAVQVDTDELPGFNPANSVTIYGPAELRYIVLTDKNVTLVDGEVSSNAGYYVFTMGEDKVKRLAIQLPPDAGDLAAPIRCAVHSPTNDGMQQVLAVLESLPPVEKSADFYPVIGVDPTLGFELIEGYGYTRGVPADGVTAAQIYVIVDATVDIANLNMKIVEGDATFDPGGQSKDAAPKINKTDGKNDGWVLVNVYSKSGTASKVQISATGVDDVVYAYPSFLQPPQI